MDSIDIFFLKLQLEEVPEIELTCIPEEIYYQVTELEMELPFEDPLEPFHHVFQD